MSKPEWAAKKPKHAKVRCGSIDGANAVGHSRPINRTNTRGTCLWCGTPLRAFKYPEYFHDPDRRGDYGDNAFCGLRCGYRFGLAFAAAGGRLTPSKG